MRNYIKIQEQRVVITGASQGLGRALALDLSKRGAKVVAIARSRDSLEKLKDEDPALEIVVGDVSDKGSIHRIAAEALSMLGHVTMLVNNASELGPTPLTLLLDTDCEDLERVLQTNLVGPFRLTKILVPSMLLHGGGTVLNISSDAAVSPYPTWGAYGVSKAALDHLSKIWSAELNAHGIRFLALDPGDMNTAMHARAIPEQDPAELLEPRRVASELADLLALNTKEFPVRMSSSEWRSQK